jgi:hypothetical protein
MLKRGSPSPSPSTWPTLGHLMLAAGTALILIAAPISVEPGSLALTWQAAHGKSDGGNGGNGGGAGASGSEHGNRGGGNGHNGQGGGHGQGQGHQGLDEVIGALGGGRAFGRERHDERFEQARQRYEQARGHGADDLDVEDRQVAHRFSAAETQHLIEHGWGAGTRDDGFRNHGERVRTMVELARRLGYGAKVGALQANFGTPYENDIAGLEAELAQPDLDADQTAELEAELEAAIAAAKPGNGDNEDWARADLDVNDDGVVDTHDLEALDAAVDDAGSDTTS